MAPSRPRPESAHRPAPEAAARSGSRGRLEVLAWLAGALVFIGIALAAALSLAYQLLVVGGRLDQRQTLAAMVAVTLYGLVVVCWLIGIAAVVRRLGAGWALGIGLAGTALVRIAASLAIDAPLVGEWLVNHQQAMAVAANGPQFGDQPPGYPLVLGGLYAFVGPQTQVAESLNVAIGLVTAAILFDVLRRTAGPMAAAVGIGLVAIFPSLALITPVVGPDPTYAALLLAAIWCLTVLAVTPARLMGRRVPAAAWASISAGIAGALLGASQYVQPTTLALLPGVVIVALVASRGASPRRAAVVLMLVYLVVLAPVVADNVGSSGQLSVQTGSLGAWALDGGGPGGVASRALDMWGDDGYAVDLGLSNGRDQPVASGLLIAGRLASALAWAVVTALAAWAIVRNGPTLPVWLLAAVLIAVSLAVLHAVIEAQPRDHSPVVPLVLGAAAVAMARRWPAERVKEVAAAPQPSPG